MNTIKLNSTRRWKRNYSHKGRFGQKLSRVYLGENVFGKVSMFKNGEHLTIDYKHPHQIIEGKEYITVNGLLKEIVSKTSMPTNEFPKHIKRYNPNRVMPDEFYDIDFLQSNLESNRGCLSPNKKYFEINKDFNISGRVLPEGFTAITDLEYSIDPDRIYILYDKENESFDERFCTLTQDNGYIIIEWNDNDILNLTTEQFYETYSMYILLTLTKTFYRDERF